MTDPHYLGILLPVQNHHCIYLGLEQADICEVEGERTL